MRLQPRRAHPAVGRVDGQRPHDVLHRFGVELHAVVQHPFVGQAVRQPGTLKSQPRHEVILGRHRIAQHAHHAGHAGREEAQVEAQNVVRVGVNGHRQPRAPQRETSVIADHHPIQRRVVDLHFLQWIGSLRPIHRCAHDHAGTCIALARGDQPIGVDILDATRESCQADRALLLRQLPVLNRQPQLPRDAVVRVAHRMPLACQVLLAHGLGDDLLHQVGLASLGSTNLVSIQQGQRATLSTPEATSPLHDGGSRRWRCIAQALGDR